MGETRSCNDAACNAACEIVDWSDWSLCSKACDGGHQERTRAVLTEARGLGTCDPADGPKRLMFGDCNTFDCKQLVRAGRSTLLCTEMIDLILILDGSGSLGRYGWEESQSMAQKLIDSMQGGDTAVNLALMLFSGPWTAPDYEKCTGQTVGDTVKADDCGIQWPARSTLTSYALAEAKNELINGRSDAKSVVVVITDGSSRQRRPPPRPRPKGERQLTVGAHIGSKTR